MSNRTAEANKAIEQAWEKERELVKAGKGTRDWTLDQQRDILSKGKAYDDNGKAFEGHHMKSVEAYPNYQNDSRNIEFLTRSEHKAAHNGNFQNATNGFYDYNSGKTTSFQEDSLTSCDINNLTTSVKMDVEETEAFEKVKVSNETYMMEAQEEEFEQQM